jgi:hypothetical protein
MAEYDERLREKLEKEYFKKMKNSIILLVDNYLIENIAIIIIQIFLFFQL